MGKLKVGNIYLNISGVKLPLEYDEKTIYSKALNELVGHGIFRGDIKSVALLKRSIDARRKSDVHFIVSLKIVLNKSLTAGVQASIEKSNKINICCEYEYPQKSASAERLKASLNPIVVGAGPAGLFAALTLAKAGLQPILIERGKSADERLVDVRDFEKTRILNTESNIQFGEGGAGTFSDGKLTTGTKNPRGEYVLKMMVEAGANEDILWKAKPHVGTDVLLGMVAGIRKMIIAFGGRVLFQHKLTDIMVDGGIDGEQLCAISVHNLVDDKHITLETNHLVLAIGHSARDTAQMLYKSKLEIEPKPFAVGIRVEHKREMIDKSQFGPIAGHKNLGSADYKLVNNPAKSSDLRSVYSFCMCPGGEVVNASSEDGLLAINGMSRRKRNAENSNSALLVGVSPADYSLFASAEFPDKLAGYAFQRSLEKAAFELGGGSYKAPVQLVSDFLKNQKSTSLGLVTPSIKTGFQCANLWAILPQYISESLKVALPFFGRKIPGFSGGDAVMTGVESRSSSPIRMLRDECGESVNIGGIFPCGEGSGYAGGIMSACVDGIMAAEHVIEKG